MKWELRHVEDTEAVLDDSGVYVIINRVETPETHKEYSGIRVSVRVDLMQDNGPTDDEPIMSFEGSANAVRKALIRFIHDYIASPSRYLSTEHASYIGYELLRAELTPGYVQD